MGSESMLWWGFVFGTIGVGYFVYGKNQRMAMPLICGISLMIFPYFVANSLVMVLLGSALLAAPFLFKF